MKYWILSLLLVFAVGTASADDAPILLFAVGEALSTTPATPANPAPHVHVSHLSLELAPGGVYVTNVEWRISVDLGDYEVCTVILRILDDRGRLLRRELATFLANGYGHIEYETKFFQVSTRATAQWHTYPTKLSCS